MRSVATGAVLAAFVLVLASASPALAQSRTPWQQHDGMEVTESNPLGLVAFTCSPSSHGSLCEYEVEDIPLEDDPGWGPARDGDIIKYELHSRVCESTMDCYLDGDFTYFQTFVDVPADVVATMRIDFSGIDDGTRVTLFNSEYPEGLVVPGVNLLVLGSFGTTNLSGFLVSGDVNRVVVTHVDDCCSESFLRSAVVTLEACTLDTCDAPEDDQ